MKTNTFREVASQITKRKMVKNSRPYAFIENEVTHEDYRAKDNTANSVYPCSIAEGIQSGDIYVNDGADVETVFLGHYRGFGYISGKPSDGFLNDIYFRMTELIIEAGY